MIGRKRAARKPTVENRFTRISTEQFHARTTLGQKKLHTNIHHHADKAGQKDEKRPFFMVELLFNDSLYIEKNKKNRIDKREYIRSDRDKPINPGIRLREGNTFLQKVVSSLRFDKV